MELQRKSRFVWEGELAKLLEEYEAKRMEYPNFAAFIPKLATFFDSYAKQHASNKE